MLQHNAAKLIGEDLHGRVADENDAVEPRKLPQCPPVPVLPIHRCPPRSGPNFCQYAYGRRCRTSILHQVNQNIGTGVYLPESGIASGATAPSSKSARVTMRTGTVPPAAASIRAAQLCAAQMAHQ